MTRHGIEPRSPGPLANTLTARPMSNTPRASAEMPLVYSSVPAKWAKTWCQVLLSKTHRYIVLSIPIKYQQFIHNFVISSCGLIPSFIWLSNFWGYLMPKPSLRNSCDSNKLVAGVISGFILFQAVFVRNVIAWLGFELTYFEAALQHFSHYATKYPFLSKN